MPNARASIKTALLALLWVLALVALNLSFPTANPAEAAAPARVLPDAGAWFAAMVALGLLLYAATRIPRVFSWIRLWVLAAFFSGVVTLGMGFAQTGTAELLTANLGLTMLLFLGRVPVYYLGMALLLHTFLHPRAFAFPPVQTAPPARQAAYPPPRGSQSMDNPAHGNPARNAFNGKAASAGGYAASQGAAANRAPVHGTASAPAHDAGDRMPRVAAHTAHSGAQNQTVSAPNAAEKPRRLAPTWVWSLAILLCWLPYLFIVWPGTVSNDSITQLAEAFGVKALSNGNPLAQTGLVWLMAHIGLGLLGTADAGIALYVCAQALLMAWLLGYTVRRLWESGAPAWLGWLALLLYALCPVFPVFAFCVGKDTNFAMAVLWFTLMVWRVLGSKWPPLRTMVGLCLSAVLCVLLRNAGAGLVGLTLLVLLVRQFIKGGRVWRAPLMALLTTGAALALLYLVALPKLNALPTPATENWSIPLQQVARTVASVALDSEEHAAIDAVMPVAEIQSAYDGELSDPVKALWRDDVTPRQQAAFFATWLRLGLKYPATYLSATFHNSYGYLYPGYVNPVKPTFLLGMEGRTTRIDGIYDFTVNPRADALKAQLKSLFVYAPFRLVTTPGGYGWVLLFAAVALLGLRRRENLVAMLPALFTLVGCFASAVNGYFRYAMPLYFLAPVLLALLAQAARGGIRGRREPQPAKNTQPGTTHRRVTPEAAAHTEVAR